MYQLTRYCVAFLAGMFLAGSALAADANVTGTWEFTVQSATGVTNPQLVLKQEGTNITGSYKGSVGAAPVTGTVKGNVLALKMTFKGQGYSFPLTYSGIVESDSSVKGKMALGENGVGGKGTFTGVKVK